MASRGHFYSMILGDSIRKGHTHFFILLQGKISFYLTVLKNLCVSFLCWKDNRVCDALFTLKGIVRL